MKYTINRLLPLIALVFISQQAFSQIVINEIMARNTTYVSDEEGEFDDYIELRNNSATDYKNLKDWHLTDTLGLLDKWQFPDDATLAPHGYLTIWADEDGSQGDLHCNFKLSGSGEELYLVNADGDIVDQITFGEQTEDMSYSRIPNGTGDFEIKAGTFGFNNENTSSIDSPLSESFSFYPNPTGDLLFVDNLDLIDSNLEIFDAMGNLLLSNSIGYENATIDLSQLTSGMYIITINGTLVNRLVKI